MNRAFTGMLFALVLAGCSGDPNEQANKLFVEAQQLIEKAEKQNPEERLQTLLSAEEKLKSIVMKYPAANLAVQLASGQSIGKISLKSASEAIAEARPAAMWAACLRTPNRTCVLDQALRAAQLRDGTEEGALALSSIALAQAKIGLMKESAANFDKVLQVARSFKDENSRTMTLVSIVKGQAEIANIRAALQAAEGINWLWGRADAFRFIAVAQAKTGMANDASANFDQAVRFAQSSDEGLRWSRLYAIAEARAKAGNVDAALQVAQSIKHEGWRGRALAEVQATAGKISDALQIAQSIDGDGLRVSALNYIANTQIKAGMTKEAATTFDLALRVAQSIKDPQQRIFNLVSIATVQAEAGFMKEATSILDQAASYARLSGNAQFPQEFAFTRITEAQAKIQAKAGNFIEALRAAQSIDIVGWRAQALSSIAELLRN